MFQKDQFQSLVVALSGFPIVRRVQIEQGHGFRLAPDIHGVGLQSLDSQGSRLFGPIGVDLNAIAMSGYAMQQVSERHAISHAGIECRELRCEGKAILQPRGFRHGQREEPSLVFPCGLIVRPPSIFRFAAAVVSNLLVLLASGGIERRNVQEPLSAQRGAPDTCRQRGHQSCEGVRLAQSGDREFHYSS